jgi:flagellar protein FliT
MTNPARALENYEILSALTQGLREAAARGEWDELKEIQQKRAALFDSMVPVDSTVTLDQPARQRKDELIQRVLTDEAEVRSLVQSHLAQLQAVLQDSWQELRLLKEYGRHAG